jgi:hypothetical protein
MLLSILLALMKNIVVWLKGMLLLLGFFNKKIYKYIP